MYIESSIRACSLRSAGIYGEGEVYYLFPRITCICLPPTKTPLNRRHSIYIPVASLSWESITPFKWLSSKNNSHCMQERHFPRIIRTMQAGLFLFTIGGSDELVEWVYVDNLVHAHILAATKLVRDSILILSELISNKSPLKSGKVGNNFSWGET